MIRTLLLILTLAAPAFAADPAPDAELLRLQAAEAAARAGKTTPSAVIRNSIPMEKKASAPAAEGEDRFMALQRDGGAPARDFAMPARREAVPTGNSVKALVAAGTTTPTAPTPKADADATNTAAGLDAMKAFRTSHGLH